MARKVGGLKGGLRPTLHSDWNVTAIGPLRTVENAVTRTMHHDGDVLNPAEKVPVKAALRMVTADAAWVADATANAIAAAAYAAGTAGARTADIGTAVASAAFAARAAVEISARAASRTAARVDYEMLLGTRTAALGPAFFKQPLWPGDYPDWWEQARRKWHETMEGSGLAPLGRQYEDWLQGELDPDLMLSEVEEWCVRYERLYGPPRRKWRSGKTIPPW